MDYNFIQNIINLKSTLLIFIAMIIIIWSGYFYLSKIKNKKNNISLYKNYIIYSLSISCWIVTNSYFHTEFLILYSESTAINIALISNISVLIAFFNAFIFSCKLRELTRRDKALKIKTRLLSVLFIFNILLNTDTDHIIKYIYIKDISDFTIIFGQSTTIFFLSLIIFATLTLYNFIIINNSVDKLIKIKSQYMIIGIVIFMLSTAIIQIGFTYFFGDFSLTWLPPALSISEITFIGYALLTSRFYSNHLIFKNIISGVISISIYVFIFKLLLIYSIIGNNTKDIIIFLLCTIISWKYCFNCTIRITKKIIYKKGLSPSDKIISLEKTFHLSIDKGMNELSLLLKIPNDNLAIIINDDNSYKSYFDNNEKIIIAYELAHEVQFLNNQNLELLYNNMCNNHIEIIIPLFTTTDNISHYFISANKSNNTIYSYEEIVALKELFNRIQHIITAEIKIKSSQALANSIAHEMRNPLAQVTLQLKEISNKTIDKKIYPHIINAKSAINHGNQLIDIILKEINGFTFADHNIENKNISDIINFVINTYCYDKDQYRNRVIFFDKQDFIIKTNPTLINFVFFNLIRNATFYFESHPESTIHIKTVTGEKYNYVIFSDFGPGIPTNIINNIFNEFFTHNKVGGSGLGLSYCKRAMEALDGTITCTSIEGIYTEFKLHIPIIVSTKNKHLPHKETNPQTPLYNFTHKTILIVDDSHTMRELTAQYLKKFNVNIAMVSNGLDAINYISHHHVDLILMDIQMPGLNGYETTARIKKTIASNTYYCFIGPIITR
ncbi:ATP-binding response regulator [Photobacterium kishitanii]|uniref:ATP-binding response regulator n=1 Tax=Photobacterium kishitanii TaxID=318456 RepID=UPI0005D3926D|nr:hybrid sensor histidine kinase/response regulator [Photobacterium kishitanii]KJG69306.1 hypothetical protein UA41_12345 [Photobacterium kishitanii]